MSDFSMIRKKQKPRYKKQFKVAIYVWHHIYICSMKKHPYKRFIDYLFGVIHLCEISFKYSSTFPKKEVK